MKRLLFLIGLFALPMGAMAQAVSGKVNDTEGQPVAYANVVLLDKDSVFLQGTVTDLSGAFEFGALPETAALVKVSFVGYDDYVAPAGEGDLGVIRMKKSAALIGEVVVTGDLPKTRVEGNALVTTVAHSVLAEAGTANDVLSKMPLVTGSDGEFSVFGAGTPVIYINGRVVRNTAELEQLSSRDIKSVEVITNPGAEYFAETNAVIKIKTVPPQGEGFSADLHNSVRVAHFMRNTDDVLLKYRRGGLELFFQGYFLGGKGRSRESSFMATYGDEVFLQELEDRTTATSTDGSGKFGFNWQKGENHSFGAYYKTGSEKEKTRGFLDTDITSGGRPYGELHQTQHGTERTHPSHEANIYYNGTAGNLSIDFNGDFMQNKKTTDDTQDERDGGGGSRTVLTDASNHNRLWAEKLTLSYPLWNGSVEVGEEYTDSHVDYHSAYTGADITGGDTEIKETNIAAFAQLSQQIGPVQAGLGIRYEHARNTYSDGGPGTRRTYDNWFPSLSLACPAGQAVVAFNFTSRTCRPTYRQLDGTLHYVNRYSYQMGNPSLKPSDNYTAQLMAQWKFFFAQASYAHEHDAIFYTTERYNGDPAVKLLVFENVSKYRQFQLAAGAQPTVGCWSPMMTLGLVNSFYTARFRGEEKKLDSPIFLANWDNAISLPGDWSLDADFMVQTAGNTQNCRVKAAGYVNLGVRKSFLADRLTLQLKANDLFDTNNERVVMYNGDIRVGSENYNESRNVVFSVRYDFNTSRSKYRGTGAGGNEKDRM